ncbi:MAG TPA: outer membrane beta-barrel protein [Sphingomicrobium sp.]|nr:outer membrane beta-barrel protein [Sphingomicrobium sp.]
MLLAVAFPLSPAVAQQAEPATDQPTQAQVAAPTEPLPPSLGPSMTGPLHLNSKPLDVGGGPFGPIYVSGVVSGLGVLQDHPFLGDHTSRVDLSNGQVIVQNTQGVFQFYLQAGGYSIPTLGTPYFKSADYVKDTYGYLPVAYLKLVSNSDFNVEIGKLYTLQGAENAYTFQNFNIERGLLFNQTSTINRGVQGNYAHGPLSVSIALTDGYYSKKYNWLSGTIGYTVSSNDSVTIGEAASLSNNNRSTFATPATLNNGELYFLSWTHTDGPRTIQSYVQVGHIPARNSVAIVHSATTYGGAILGKYSFNEQWSLAARAEVIMSTGSLADGAPSLVYGPGSGAWSLTLTPTWQKGIFFARAEGSYAHAWRVTPGFGLGPNFTDKSQFRGLIEAGVIF